MSLKNPSDFKWRHFHGEVILQCVRWYCKYGISYRDLEEMMSERGLELDHTTVYRWVQHYGPKLKKRLDWYKKRYASRWHLDETYIKVHGSICIERLMKGVTPLIFICRIGAMLKRRNDF